MDRFSKIDFLSNGSWVCPAGVTKVLLCGFGGGSGGNGGSQGTGGAGNKGGEGGVATTPQWMIVDVVPNTTYNITIGAGGNGGAPDIQGLDGGNTTFGGLFTFYGAGSSIFIGIPYLNASTGVYSFPQGNKTNGANDMTVYPKGGCGISPNFSGYNGGTFGYAGYSGLLGGEFLNGATGATIGGWGGGGMSGTVKGPAGGIGRAGMAGTNGGNGAANSGCGGGGGGGGSSGSTNGGSGGNGGSGRLTIMWVE